MIGGLWSRVFAATYDRAQLASERAGLAEMRHELLARARGRTLEIGAGTGLNLEHYPRDGVELTLTEPAAPMARRLERRASTLRPDARVLSAPAENLPVETGSVDCVVSTLVLCTVADPLAVLTEVRRVLAPSGIFLFLEHVRDHDPRRARRQDLVHPLWVRFACGCHCNRPTLSIIESQGFSVERVEYGTIPKVISLVRPLIVGVAHPHASAAQRVVYRPGRRLP